MQKRGFLCILLLALAVIFGGCSSSGDRSASQAASESAKSIDSSGSSNSLQEMKVDATNSESLKAEEPAGGQSSSKASTSGFTGQEGKAEAGKKLIYKADLTMQVKDYKKAQTDIRSTLGQAGGYIVQFSETQNEDQLEGNLVMKIPAAGFTSFIDAIGRIKHESLTQNIEGQDVTEEYVDLESRLKAKQIMEERYTTFMKKATKTDELVAFANELGQIQEEIEQAKGRMRYIDNNVSYSTVSLQLYQKNGKVQIADSGKENTPLLERAGNALTGTLHILYLFMQWLLVLLSGALPVLIIASIIGIVVWRVRRTRTRSRAAKRESFRQPPSPVAQPSDHSAAEQQEDVRMNGETTEEASEESIENRTSTSTTKDKDNE